MKYLILIISIVLCEPAFSQNRITVYIEVRGSVDMLGNIYLNNLQYPRKNLEKIDSLIDYKSLNTIALKLKEPIKVIDEFSLKGWQLVSVCQVFSDKSGSPNSPFLLYYFKKEFVIESK
jgi:hypothetical protein